MTLAIRPQHMWRRARKKKDEKSEWDMAVTKQNKAGMLWTIAYWPFWGLITWLLSGIRFTNEAISVLASLVFLAFFLGFVAISRLLFRLPDLPALPEDPPLDHSLDPTISWD